MADRRRFLIRLALAGGAMLMLCVGCFLGLGWAVTRHSDWLVKMTGADRYDRMYRWYARAADGLMPWDSDGDGFSDGMEMFFGTSPRDAASFPDTNAHVGINVAYTAYCGEWMPVRGVLKVDSLELRIVPGTPYEVSGNDPAMVFRQAAGSPPGPTVTTAAAPDGKLYFEYEFTGPATGNSGRSGAFVVLKITNLRTRKTSPVFIWPSYGWRGPKMPVTLCDDTGAPLGDPPSPNEGGKGVSVYFVRPEGWEKARYFFLEHRRKKEGSAWSAPAVLNPAFGELYRIRPEWLEQKTLPTEFEWQISTALKAPPP